MLPGLYGPVFQTGYVTEDLDRAIDLFARDHGIVNWFRTPTVTLATVTGGEMSVDIGLAWVGRTMVEIVALGGGDDHLYRQILPPGEFAVRFHHLGYRIHNADEWKALQDLAAEKGLKTVLDVKTASTDAIYLDTRDRLGHYMEYLYYHDEPNSSLPRIPQNWPQN